MIRKSWAEFLFFSTVCHVCMIFFFLSSILPHSPGVTLGALFNTLALNFITLPNTPSLMLPLAVKKSKKKTFDIGVETISMAINFFFLFFFFTHESYSFVNLQATVSLTLSTDEELHRFLDFRS